MAINIKQAARHWCLHTGTVLLLLACGGGSSDGGGAEAMDGSRFGGAYSSAGGGSAAGGSTDTSAWPAPTDIPTPAQASRLLGQASFGATTKEIKRLETMGLRAWIEDQFNKPQALHRTYIDQITAATGETPSQFHFYQSFWRQVAKGEDQLRQRVAFALSQIFVISYQSDALYNYPRGVAAYYDMLGQHAFGNFRNLLEVVSLHPMMGIYLTSIRNQKESDTRVPDENFAREVMQLMTIGLYELNQDGTLKRSGGKPIETYTNADIAGLAKVFTGWSWAGPDKSDTRFYGGNADPSREWRPMQNYPKFHSMSEKKFLGTTIPANTGAEASLKIALDTLFNHPNVGPFIGKQLIQRLVTSNPSPQYVARVAAAFANNGHGVRGDMKAVIRAILLDPEARSDAIAATNPHAGKLREPVLRLANWIRAFNAQPASGRFMLGNLDEPLTSLGQTPMRSPSVFNFYRPGYVPPNSSIAAAGLLAPEMQITGETSVVGYLNFMLAAINTGAGNPREIQSSYATELALASQPDKLLDHLNLLLMANQMPASLRNQIITALNAIAIPANDPDKAAAARLNRVKLAVFLTMASPKYLVQK